MKNSPALFVIANLILVVLLSTSCQKEESQALSEEEAVEIIEASLQSSTGGATATTTDYTQELVNDATVNGICNTVYTDSFSFMYDSLTVEANWDIIWSYTMTCNNLNIPTSASFTSSSSGTFSTNRINSTSSSTASLSATGLELSSSAVSFNGSFTFDGTQDISVRNSRSLSSDVDITMTNVMVSKTSFEVLSGAATVSLEGNGTQVGAFSYIGNVVFNGNGSATLSLNGNSYTINL